jgi:hypothetical protein
MKAIVAGNATDEMAGMPDSVKVEYLKRKLAASYERESRHALAASSLDELVSYAVFHLQNIDTLNSCGAPARRSIARLAIHLRRSMEEIADGREYHPPRLR